MSLAKVSLWPKCLWPKCLWPKCHWPVCNSGQSIILAKLSRPKCLWPNCHSGRIVIQPFGNFFKISLGQISYLRRTLIRNSWPFIRGDLKMYPQKISKSDLTAYLLFSAKTVMPTRPAEGLFFFFFFFLFQQKFLRYYFFFNVSPVSVSKRRKSNFRVDRRVEGIY